MRRSPSNRLEKVARLALTATLATGIAAYAIAEPDYHQIKKDINVMIGIVKSSFNHNPDCDDCRIRISGHYLADQGVVFDVSPASGYARFAFKGDDFVTEDLIAPLPPMVEEIIADVRMNFADDFTAWEFYSGDESMADMTREARHQLRESRQQLREISREMREIEIESIHAESEEQRELEERRAELEARMAEAERQHAEVEKTLHAHAEKKRQAEQEKLAKRQEKVEQRFKAMESTVLNTFCDYSGSMRNIPRGEKVSIIVRRSDETSNVYVFSQDTLEDCDSRKTNVREHALSYAF